MANGWEKLGAALSGVSDGDREDIRNKTMNALAQRDYNIQRAKGAIMKQQELERLGDSFEGMGFNNAGDLANAARAGQNVNQLYGGLEKQQKMGFRQAAVNAPTFGDANRQLMGVASGPQAVAAVQGNTVLGNRFVEGGDIRGSTDVGRSMEVKNYQQGNAAQSRASTYANRPSASRAPKLDEFDKRKLDVEDKKITAAQKQLTDQIADFAGSSKPENQAKAAALQKQLEVLDQARDALYDQYRGKRDGVPIGDALAPGSRVASNFTSLNGAPPLPAHVIKQIQEAEMAGNRDFDITGSFDMSELSLTPKAPWVMPGRVTNPAPSAAAPKKSVPKAVTPTDQARAIAYANSLIESGADPAAVRQRLLDMGIQLEGN